MRLIKMTGGLGNQMFIYALYISMKQRGLNACIDLSDMMHYHVHHGYEMHRVFGLPRTELILNQGLKKVIEFLFFKTILERKQGGRLEPFFGKHHWPLIYYKGFYQNERYFADCKDEVRRLFTFNMAEANELSVQMAAQIEYEPLALFHSMCAVAITFCPNISKTLVVYAHATIIVVLWLKFLNACPMPASMYFQTEWIG